MWATHFSDLSVTVDDKKLCGYYILDCSVKFAIWLEITK